MCVCVCVCMCVYTNLTLAYSEENLYEIIGKKYGNDIKEDFTKSWKIYLLWNTG